MKSLLNISDIDRFDINNILTFSEHLLCNIEPVLLGKNIGLIFEKNSTRTRLSFQTGINQLSGNYIDIKFEELNLNRFESFEDTFEIINCYLDAIVFRTTNHQKLVLASKFFKKPIINALSDLSHPCQAISDIFTLKQRFKRLNNLKILWMGDVNNVLYSFAEIVNILGDIDLSVFTDEKIYKENEDFFKNFNFIKVKTEVDKKILQNVDCVMTDVFISMNDKDDSKENCLKRFQVNKNIMSLTKDDTVFMHCLPAKIGSEVTEDVIKSSKSIVVKQAENRLHVQKGILKWLNI